MVGSTQTFFIRILFFGLKLDILIKIWTLRLRLFLEYSYFCHYSGRILQLFNRILQFQPQGIPRIFLIFTKSQPDILINIFLKKKVRRSAESGDGLGDLNLIKQPCNTQIIVLYWCSKLLFS